MEEKNVIINLKDSQSVCTYLEFLQDIISRMGGNSNNTKALIAVIYTVFVTVFVAVQQIHNYWWIGFVISIIGLIMDTYYLALEKMYRNKYNKIVNDLNNNKLDEKEIFNMNPKNTDLKFEIISMFFEALLSFSIIPFYIMFIILTILLGLI